MSEVFVHKVTLGTGKIVLIREPKIKDQDLATRAAATKVNKTESPFMFGSSLQKEMLKLLLVQVGEKRPSAIEIEDLDSLLTYGEYMQCLKVVGKISGFEEDMGNFQMELEKPGV